MEIRLRSPLIFTLSGILWAFPLVRAWPQAPDAFQFFQEEAQVVAASQHAQKISQAPARAYVVTAEDIERYGYRTLGEVLQSLPGVYVTNDRNYSYVWLRGFGLPSDYNNRVLVLVDGHRVNDDVYGSSYVGEEFSVDVKAVDHVELIKGPGSSLYGESAFFGVINVVTKTADRAPRVQASAEGGSYGTHKEFAGVAQTWANGAKAYASGSYRSMQGQDLFYPAYANSNDGVASGCDHEHGGTFYGKLSYGGFILSGNHGSRTKNIPTGSFSTLFNNPDTQTRDEWSFAELHGEHQVLPEVLLTSRLYYDWYDYDGLYLYANAVPPPDTTQSIDMARSRSYGEELRTRLTFFGNENALTLGEEYHKTAEGLQQNSNAGVSSIDVNAAPQRWATYLQQELQPYSRLSLTLGFRYDYYQTFGKTINPRVALVHQLWKDGVLKALYGSAFRAPSAYEMFYADGVSFAANPVLDPEKITSYELVWEQQFPGAGMVSLSGYENLVTNLIEQKTIPDGRIQFQNASSIKSIGLEVYSKWTFNKYFSGFAGYNLQNTREINGAPLSNSPVHSGSAGLTTWVEPTKTRVSLQAFLISGRRTFQQTTLPATTLFSLTLREQPWPSGPTLFASIYNLLDTPYAVSGAAEHLQDAIPQDGRNFILGLEYKFQ